MSSVDQFMIPIKFKSQEFTAIASQSVFTLTTVTIPNADIENCRLNINGKTQPDTAYTVDSTTQITTSEPLEAGDFVEVVVIGRS